MRTRIARLTLAAMLLAGVLSFMTLPAHADPGGPFQPGDNRINPMTGDRLVIYCNNNNVDIWGVDSLEGGFPLTTFSVSELTKLAPSTHQTASGTVTLKLDNQPVVHWGFADQDSTTLSQIVDTGTQYDVSWNGFDKSFSCTYLPIQQSAAARQ